jgi:hypothetical protein
LSAKALRRRKLSWIALGLVLIVGLALILFIGPLDGSNESSAPHFSSALEKKADRIERRLARNPEDRKLLLATMEAWIEAGNDRLSKIDTATQPIPSAVAEDFRVGLRTWNPFLRQTGGEASVSTAELAGGTYFKLLEIGSPDLGEIESNAAEAARALRIAGKHSPNLFTLSNVAVYEYFNGEFAAGDKAAKGAAADVTGAEVKGVREQLDEYRERGERFRDQLRRAADQLRQSGQEQLEEPLKAFASSTGINKDE